MSWLKSFLVQNPRQHSRTAGDKKKKKFTWASYGRPRSRMQSWNKILFSKENDSQDLKEINRKVKARPLKKKYYVADKLKFSFYIRSLMWQQKKRVYFTSITYR